MMIRKSLIVLTTVFTLSTTLMERDVKAIANSYTQGVYKISEFKDYVANAKLITPNKQASLVITDREGDIRLFKKFDKVDEIVNLGTITVGDKLTIIGDGEVAVIPILEK